MPKKNSWRRLPGFRSGAARKLVTASIVYIFLLIGVVVAVESISNIGNNAGKENAANTETTGEDTALKTCSDFDNDQQLYTYWTDHEFSSENDPGDLDANGDGVPCAVLSESMEDEFTAYEKEQTGQAAEPKTPSYTLYEGSNTNYDDIVYVNYYVIPDADPTSVNESDIDAISAEVIKELKAKEEFNLLTISFVDAEEAMEYGGYIYGKTDYFPNGEINDAAEYETGDYSDHEVTTVYGSINNEGLPKQQENYPAEKQLDMYFYWAGPAYEKNTGSDTSPAEATADKFGVSEETVEQAVQQASHR